MDHAGKIGLLESVINYTILSSSLYHNNEQKKKKKKKKKKG
jgi:hypothetical protein